MSSGVVQIRPPSPIACCHGLPGDRRVTVPVTAVLVHGAGHTSAVWRRTQTAMRSPSLAVDLPGRGARPADITRVTVEQAADSVGADIRAMVEGDLTLVGHSVAGTVLPS